MLLPVGLVSGVFLVLSVRLCRSAWRAGGAEAWLGLFFLMVGLAMPLRVVLQQDGLVTGESKVIAGLVAHGLLTVGTCAFTLFVARVFRGESLWGGALAALLIALQLAGPLVLIVFGGHRNEVDGSVLVVATLRALPFAWGFFESFRYHRQMRRRALLGLSDPVVTNRFALFAIWNGLLFLLPMVVVAIRATAAVVNEGGRLLPAGEATGGALVALARVSILGLGLATAATLWLGFFPPAAWIAWLTRRAGDTTSPPVAGGPLS